MIWLDIIEIAHSQSQERPKRSRYLTAIKINRKGDAGILIVRVPSAMRFLAGRTAKKSIELGFQVDVCPEIHARLHANCDDWARIENRKWKMYYQTKYEEEQIAAGATEEEARADWMALIGRNYL